MEETVTRMKKFTPQEIARHRKLGSEIRMKNPAAYQQVMLLIEFLQLILVLILQDLQIMIERYLHQSLEHFSQH